MAALTLASPADLPPLGELVADDPFWRYPSISMAREGVAHLRVWLTAGLSPGTWLSSPKLAWPPPSQSPPGISGTALTGRYGPSLVCSSTTLRLRLARACRHSILSAWALMAARTGPASGRPRRTIPVTPGWSYGWLLVGTRSSAGRRVHSTGVRARAAEINLVRPGKVTPSGVTPGSLIARHAGGVRGRFRAGRRHDEIRTRCREAAAGQHRGGQQQAGGAAGGLGL